MDAGRQGGSYGRRCSASAKSTGERCRNAPLRGAVVCRVHGGNAPQVRAAAARREAEASAAAAAEVLGVPVETTPADAVTAELAHAAGHVAWLRARLADAGGFDSVGVGDPSAATLWTVLLAERDRLVTVTRVMLAAQVGRVTAETAQELGAWLVRVLDFALADSGLPEAQADRVRGALPYRIRSVPVPGLAAPEDA